MEVPGLESLTTSRIGSETDQDQTKGLTPLSRPKTITSADRQENQLRDGATKEGEVDLSSRPTSRFLSSVQKLTGDPLRRTQKEMYAHVQGCLHDQDIADNRKDFACFGGVHQGSETIICMPPVLGWDATVQKQSLSKEKGRLKGWVKIGARATKNKEKFVTL
mmetsp:Transcript_22400/g.22586  ORF Transcript_22400/g.22586 Transcript_22400/m.22586 type:complete len:163 (+) Transcript_22400:133-621(+)